MTAANLRLWLSYMSFFKCLLRSALIAPFLIATANAITLDWNTVLWTAGSLSSSHDVDAAKTGNDGTTLIAPTITTSANDPQSGSGINQAVTGTISTTDTVPGSDDGTVTITFGANAIKSFTFTYGSGGPSDVTDTTYQHVGIESISFTPIPEINPAWSAVGSCLLAAALILRHSAKFRK